MEGLRLIALRDSEGQVRLVKCWPGGRKVEVSPRRSQRVWNHSPTGFELGYGGSGPAQLALAILLEAGLPKDHAVRLHQAFKMRFVAPATGGIDLLRSDVLTWAFDQDAGEMIPWLQQKGIVPTLPRPAREEEA